MRLSLALKLYLSFMALFGAVVLGSIFNYLVTQYNATVLADIQNRHFPHFELSNRVTFKTQSLQESLQDALITDDESDLKKSRSLIHTILSDLNSMKAVQETDSKRVDEIINFFKAYHTGAEAITSQVVSGKKELGDLAKPIAQMQLDFNRFEKSLDEYRHYRQQVFNNAIKEASRKSSRNILLGFATLAIGVAVTITMTHFNKIYISRPIKELSDASQLMSVGTIPEPVNPRTDDELGDLTKQFNQMVTQISSHKEKMEFIIRSNQIISGTHTFSDLAHELSLVLKFLGDGAAIRVYLTPANFLTSDQQSLNAVFLLKKTGELVRKDLPNSPSQRMEKVIEVHDPKTNVLLAFLNLDDVPFETYVNIRHTIQAISNSIASALITIRLEEAMRLLEDKTAEIRSLFAIVPVGIGILQSDMKIVGETSTHLETLFPQVKEESFSLVNHLFPGEREIVSQINSVFELSMGEDAIFFDMNSHLLPKHSSIREPHEMEFEIDWVPLEKSTGEVEGIMINVRDVTELRTLEAESQKKTREVAMIQQVLEVDDGSFKRFYHDMSRMLSTFDKRFNEKDLSLLLDLHTLKGNARLIGLRSLSQLIHQIEDQVERKTDNLKETLTRLKEEADEYQNIFQKYRQQKGSPNKEYPMEKLHSIIQDIEDNGDLIHHRSTLHRFILNEMTEKLSQFVNNLSTVAASISEQLGILPPSVILIDSTNMRLSHESVGHISGVFNHLIANSIAHGISQGGGKISLKVHNNIIEYYDSGKGLNITQIQKKYEEKKNKPPPNEECLLDFLFESQISTSTLSEISGRGVGLTAAKNLMMDIGGDLKIKFTGVASSNGFRTIKFQLVLPKEHIYHPLAEEENQEMIA